MYTRLHGTFEASGCGDGFAVNADRYNGRMLLLSWLPSGRNGGAQHVALQQLQPCRNVACAPVLYKVWLQRASLQ